MIKKHVVFGAFSEWFGSGVDTLIRCVILPKNKSCNHIAHLTVMGYAKAFRHCITLECQVKRNQWLFLCGKARLACMNEILRDWKVGNVWVWYRSHMFPCSSLDQKMEGWWGVKMSDSRRNAGWYRRQIGTEGEREAGIRVRWDEKDSKTVHMQHAKS